MVQPGFLDHGILGIPSFPKVIKAQQCLFLGRGAIDPLKVPADSLEILVGNKLCAVAYHMDNAELDSGLWEHSPDSIGESGKAIHTSNENVIDTAVLQVREDTHPELGTLCLAEIEAQDFLVSFHIDPQGYVQGLVLVLAALPAVYMRRASR